MADKKKSLKVSPDKKKSVRASSSRMAEADKKRSLIVSSPSPPMADRKKSLKPDPDIISILTNYKDSYQSDKAREVVTPRRLSRSLREALKEPLPGKTIGRLVFREGDYMMDCSKRAPCGILTPCMVHDYEINIISSDALFILLVENDTAYQMLALIEFYNRFPCIIVSSGNAVPDTGTRMFLKKLHTELNLPVLALVDSTARGMQSLYFYKSKVDDDSLWIPDIKWLGMKPSDLDKHGIPENCRLRMKRGDIKTVKDLLKDESVRKNQGWVDEMSLMLGTKQMAEIEAFSVFDFENFDFEYLWKSYSWEVYLPLMLQEQDWL